VGILEKLITSFLFEIKRYIIRKTEFFISKNFMFFLMFHRLACLFFIKNKPINKKLISVINTFDVGGGAAKIANQISLTSNKDYISRFFVKSKKSEGNSIFEIPEKKYSLIEELLRREAMKKGWIEFSGFHGLNLLNDSFFNSSYIVHLNNLHGEFISPSIFKILFKGKKVIWTLHDESLITGHCSCTLGCVLWKIGCGDCPDLSIFPKINYDNTKNVLKYKKKWISELQPIIVCPSNWLAERVRIAYRDLKSIKVIPNGVDLDVFYPRDKEKSRLHLNLPLEKKIVLFVAEFATLNPFKGGEILRDIIKDPTYSDLIFVTVGGQHETDFENHISYPYIKDEFELSLLYSSCDILLYPTQADNFPLVVLESMACGTPVIASNIGGIPEIIKNNHDGFLISDYTLGIGFKTILNNILKENSEYLRKISENSVLKIKKNFTLQIMLEKYNSLYE
jgi:glycosyltransferase involved in cell wall biosynthesis